MYVSQKDGVVLRNASVGMTCCLLPLFDTQMCLCLPNACPYFGQCLLPLSVFLSASLAHPFVPNGAVPFRFLRGLPVALARARAERTAERARATNQQNVFYHDRRRKRERAASSAMRYRVDLDEYSTALSNGW